MKKFNAGRLKDLVRIERPVKNDSFTGAGSGTWALVDEVRVEIEDMPPGRDERLAGGISVATRPAKVRMRKRDDVTSAMRFVKGSRIMQIVGGPAAIGTNREGQEWAVEEYRPAGNAAA